MTINSLVGKTVVEVFLADDQEAIKFDVIQDNTNATIFSIIARCDGDCCSHTWIEDVINPEVLIGSPVLSVEDLELPTELCGKTKLDSDSYYEEEMQYYGCAVKTDKGTCTIGYRNSSNGYYGGNLVWPNDDYYYGGVFGQNMSNEKWVKIA